MRFSPLALKDKSLFRRFLGLAPHRLSPYAFENIYIWKGLFEIRWAIIRENLCIFFRDKIGSFLYLPPLGKNLNPQAVTEAFQIMDGCNANRDISRIENLEEKDAHFYRGLGYEVRHKSSDYLCRRADLAQLKGDRFKSKRSGFNYFLKHYRYRFLNFSPQNKGACLDLYNLWAQQRSAKIQDTVYRGMLRDSYSSLAILLDDYRRLNITGRIVEVQGQLKAFTFGFQLCPRIFCILYEITDLNIKGLAQFIFREFCRELKGYHYINIMDDSGLENLKAVKLSYRPERLVPAYIAKRNFPVEPARPSRNLRLP